MNVEEIAKLLEEASDGGEIAN
jgi:hypothetical protein